MKGESILCLAAANWSGMWARAQQFMTIFARQGNRVLYVDPPVTYLSPLKNPSLRGQAADRLRRVDERICVYTPPVILPFGNIYRSINRINQRILGAGIKAVALSSFIFNILSSVLSRAPETTSQPIFSAA
jgi:hypothetical protein